MDWIQIVAFVVLPCAASFSVGLCWGLLCGLKLGRKEGYFTGAAKALRDPDAVMADAARELNR